MFLGLRSLIHPAPDLEASKAFYTAMLGKEPYFNEPFYVGYSVGGFELGLWPAGEATRMIEVCSPTGDIYGLMENPGFLADPPPAIYTGPGR